MNNLEYQNFAKKSTIDTWSELIILLWNMYRARELCVLFYLYMMRKTKNKTKRGTLLLNADGLLHCLSGLTLPNTD